MFGVATTSYAPSLTSVSSEEAGACHGFRIYRHVVLGHGCLYYTTVECTLGVLRHGSTAMSNLRHMVACAAFFPGHAL